MWGFEIISIKTHQQSDSYIDLMDINLGNSLKVLCKTQHTKPQEKWVMFVWEIPMWFPIKKQDTQPKTQPDRSINNPTDIHV